MKTTVKEPLLVRPLYSWVTSSGSHRRGISTSRALAHLSSGGCWGSGGLDFDGLNTMNVTIGVTIRWLGFRFWRGSGRVRVSGSGRRVLSLGVFGFRFFGFRMFGSSRVYGLCGEDVLFVCFAFFFCGAGGVGRRHHNRHHHQHHHRHLLLRQYARRCFQYDCDDDV